MSGADDCPTFFIGVGDDTYSCNYYICKAVLVSNIYSDNTRIFRI